MNPAIMYQVFSMSATVLRIKKENICTYQTFYISKLKKSTYQVVKYEYQKRSIELLKLGMQNWKNLNVQNRLKYVCIALFHDQKLSLSFCGRKIAYWSHCTSAVYSLFFYARGVCQKAHSTLLTFGHYRTAQGPLHVH